MQTTFSTIAASVLLATSLSVSADWSTCCGHSAKAHAKGQPEFSIRFDQKRGEQTYATFNISTDDPNYPGSTFYGWEISVDGKLVESVECDEPFSDHNTPILKMSTVNAIVKGSTMRLETDDHFYTYDLKGSAAAIKAAYKNRYVYGEE